MPWDEESTYLCTVNSFLWPKRPSFGEFEPRITRKRGARSLRAPQESRPDPKVRPWQELVGCQAVQAWAGRRTRPILAKPFSICVRNSRIKESVVIEPTSQFDQKMPNEPEPEIIASRKASSALLPSTSAKVSGASGMPIFLKT